MKIKVSALHFNADQKLIDFTSERVNKLETFFDKIIEGEVTFKVDKSNSNENKVAEIKLNIPGKDLFAKKQCKSFEEAVDQSVEALRRQLRKQKTKN
jgi:putative sigma-54 modulation protein|tara:strand:- start:404 stop:694 length:291 start_codon:yes stop_codon:yes gene_type:complete